MQQNKKIGGEKIPIRRIYKLNTVCNDQKLIPSYFELILTLRHVVTWQDLGSDVGKSFYEVI